MAKDYSAALERMREKSKEEAAKNVAPSSLPSPPVTEKKDYTEAIARMRRLSEHNTHMATVYSDRAKRQQEWVNTRTQDVIKAELEEAKKNDGNARVLSGEWWKDIGQEAAALVTGKMDEVTANRTENAANVDKLTDELARRQAYDYGLIDPKNGEVLLKAKFDPNVALSDSFYGYINRDPAATERYISTETMEVPGVFREYFGMSEPQAETMTDDEIVVYNYIYATEGKNKANEYYEYLRPTLNARYRGEKTAESISYAEEHKGAASAKSLLTNIGSAIATTPGMMAQWLVTGEVDENDPLFSTTHQTNALREGVKKNWGPVGSTAYDIGMSLVDMLTSYGVSALSGGMIPMQAIMSSSATATSTLDALDRGVSVNRAMAIGITSGAVEALTEQWSIDALLKDFSEKGIRQYIISNILSEASEEAIAEVANTLTDAILAQDKSYWTQKVNAYKKNGMTEGQAVARALMSTAGDVIVAGAGGALSGGILSGGRVAINTGANALQDAGDAAAKRDNAYRGQNTIRDILNSDKYKDMRNEQKKYTVLPTAVDEEIKAARDRGEVFDIGYDKPYTGVADTLDDMDLQRKIDAAETLTEKTGLRHGASEQDITDALEMSRALGVEIEFFNQSSKETSTVLDGFYNSENGHIYINVNAAKGKADNSTIPVVISHEFTHSLEGTDAYNDLRQLVEKELKKRGDSIEAAAERLNTVYEKSGRGQSMKANEADVIANFVEKNVLGSKESIQSIVGAKPNFGRRVLAFLNRILAQFRRGSSAYTTVNQIRDQYADTMSSEAEEAPTVDGVAENMANVTNESEENAQQDEESENEADEEVITEEETPVTEDSERSQERDAEAEEKPAETKKSPERENRGSKADTGTVVFDDAEDMMREAERAHEAGEITDEQLATVEGWYDQWYETGMKPDMSSDGFEEGKIPKALRGFFTGRSGVRWSVSEIIGEKRNYGRGVILDTNIFNNIKPRNWGPVLRNYVYNNFAGTQLEMYDEDGTPETVYIAKKNERVTKNGAKNSHKVIDELARYKGDNIKALTIVHIPELLQNTYVDNKIVENNHQWLDRNGWEYRKVYVQDRNGNIYEATINIADSGDRKILYAINNVRLVDKKRTTGGVVPSTANGRGSHTTHSSSTPTIPYSVSYVNSENEDVTKLQQLDKEFETGHRGNGYDGYSMSNNARRAYEQGEMPLSKWTKSAIVEAVWEINPNIDISKVNLDTLKKMFLTPTSWHHTSMYYNATDFYSVNESYVEGLTQDDVDSIAQNQVRRQTARRSQELDRLVDEAYAKSLIIVEAGVLSTEKRAIDSLRSQADFEKNYQKALDIIKNRDAAKVAQWRHLPQGHWRQSYVELYDTDFDDYVKKMYADRKLSKNSNVFREIAKHFEGYNGISYSVSNTTDEAETDSTSDAYTVLPTKAKTYLRKVEDRIGRAFDRALELGLAGENGSYRTKDFKEFLTDAVRPITNEYLTTGTVSRETISRVFEKYYKSPNGLPSSLYDQAKMDARGVFENIINENWNDLNYVRRYAEATNREKAKLENMAEITREDARKRFDTLKSAQKFERKVMRDNLLTDDDMLTVGKLLRKEISFENLNPIKDNVKGIRAVYEAKLQTLEASDAVAEYKRYVKAQYYAYWDGKLDTMFEWKDKGAGIRYQRETLERNIRDIVPDKALADQIIREVIYPVHKHEADSTKWKTDMKKRVEALGLSAKVKKGDTVSESYAVQFYGEAIDNIKMLEANPDRRAKRDGYTLEEWKAALNNMWEKSPSLDETKIKNAAEEFRKIYEEIFEQMNDVRLDNGYAPVAYRRGYFPHFTGEEETLLAKFGRAMGIKTEMMALPTTINGLTENFKPGITWFGHAQERQGIYTTYDAVTGFEQYIKGAADVIFHTEDIQRFRALANRIRYNASNDGIRAEMDKIEANEELDDAQKDAALEEIRHNGKYALSNFVAYIDEYTNKLANKKSKLDRGIESLFGRRIYMVVNNLESRVAANMIAANLGSAMTNFIPINQAASQLGWGWMLKGLQGTYKSVAGGDNIRDASTFLVNRRGYDPIVKNWLDKVSDIAQMLMELIDTIASEMIVRAAYAKNLDSGMTSDEALYQADLFAASVMADRSKGAVPLIFENKNPIMKLFTQFQVEVNNEFSVIFKDIPRRERKKWTDAIALVLLKYFLGAFLYNELYELIVGRRAALDPIGTVVDTVEDISAGKPWGSVVGNTFKDVGAQLPFLGGVLFEGGRIPISSAMPDWENLWNAISSDGKDSKKRAEMIWKEASAPLYYWILPFGGGQLKRIVQTIDTAIQGGKYTLDNDGNPQLQYPMFMDTTADKILNPLRSLAFGSTSLPTAQDWIDNDFKKFGVKETATYDALKEVGVSGRDAYDFLLDLRGAEKTEERSLDAVKRDIIRDSDLSAEGKFVAYRTLVAKEKEQELMDNLDDLGADPGEVVNLMLRLKDATKATEKRELILNSNLKDDEKRLVYENRITADHSEAIRAFEDAGMNFDTFLKAKNFDAQISENKELSTSERATELARWANKQGFTAEQQDVIRDNIREYTKSTKYDDFTEAGLDDETAYKLTSALADLDPPEGKKQVTDLQKYRAVIDTIASPADQMKALEAVMDESAFKQASAAVSYGIDPEKYVAFRESLTAFDSNGNGSLSQAEVETALNSLSGNLSFKEQLTLELTGGSSLVGSIFLSNDQLAVLWQLANTNWKAKNNPYNPKVGQAVLDLLGKGEKE